MVLKNASNGRSDPGLVALLREAEQQLREVVFCQGQDVLTRRWTWRQAAGTQTLPETSAVFFNIDGLPPTLDDDVRAAMADIARLASEYTGATVAFSSVLSVDLPRLVLARPPSP